MVDETSLTIIETNNKVISDVISGDIVIILSSEMIAEVMEVHFNKKMFKQGVKIVDLKPSDDGYAFTLGFVKQAEQYISSVMPQTMELTEKTVNNVSIKQWPQHLTDGYGDVEPEDIATAQQKKRDNKGRFTKNASTSHQR